MYLEARRGGGKRGKGRRGERTRGEGGEEEGRRGGDRLPLPGTAVDRFLITVKLLLLFTLLTERNQISPAAAFTYISTAELSHIP